MNFNRHSNLEGTHALFSPSRAASWWNKNDAEVREFIQNYYRAQRGTAFHKLAHDAIILNKKMPRSHDSFDMFVNDAIGYRMTSERILYYSEHCYGTADAISFRDNKVRIHDLKTGRIPAHPEQLIAYIALFCLENGIKPSDIEKELRIYQSGEVIKFVPDDEDIKRMSEKIILVSNIADEMKYGG